LRGIVFIVVSLYVVLQWTFYSYYASYENRSLTELFDRSTVSNLLLFWCEFRKTAQR